MPINREIITASFEFRTDGSFIKYVATYFYGEGQPSYWELVAKKGIRIFSQHNRIVRVHYEEQVTLQKAREMLITYGIMPDVDKPAGAG